MTVEAVPRFDADGNPVAHGRAQIHEHHRADARPRRDHRRLRAGLARQRVPAARRGDMPAAEKALAYLRVYQLALIIPVVSVLGVVLASALRWRDGRRLMAKGFARSEARRMLNPHGERPPINWWILGGGLRVCGRRLARGRHRERRRRAGDRVRRVDGDRSVPDVAHHERARAGRARHVLVGTAALVFVFRAMPSPGAGSTWWMIDQLGFDQQFLAELSLIGSVLTLAGLFIFRRFMAERSIAYIVGSLDGRRHGHRRAGRRHVLRPAPLDRGPYRRRRGRAHDRAHRHRDRIAAGPDRDGADAGVDRELARPTG
mgnify:CR=1 FL=1